MKRIKCTSGISAIKLDTGDIVNFEAHSNIERNTAVVSDEIAEELLQREDVILADNPTVKKLGIKKNNEQNKLGLLRFLKKLFTGGK